MVNQNDIEYIPATWVDGPPRLLISCLIQCRFFFHNCPHSQTLEGYSTQFKCTVWLALPCKRWSCHFCATQKIKRLARKTESAAPNRLITLTVDPKLWENPRAAFDGTRRKLPELVKQIRAKFGECEYLRVTELTRGGWPHYHMMVRSPYISHAWLKAAWQKLTGAIIVDVRQVKDHFNSFTYLVKYLTKMHQIDWTERHCSYSKNFFPPEEPLNRADLGLTETKIYETHPADLVYHQFRQSELVELQWGVFTLNPSEEMTSQFHSDGTETFSFGPPKGKPCDTSPPNQPHKASTQSTQPNLSSRIFGTASTHSKPASKQSRPNSKQTTTHKPR